MCHVNPNPVLSHRDVLNPPLAAPPHPHPWFLELRQAYSRASCVQAM